MINWYFGSISGVMVTMVTLWYMGRLQQVHFLMTDALAAVCKITENNC